MTRHVAWERMRAARAVKYIIMAKVKAKGIAPIVVGGNSTKEGAVKSAREARGFVKVWVIDIESRDIVWDNGG